ncbi:MAG: transcriptional regulator, IclR family [Devosia sp.]|jgi:DNA-binding IclR family transcriptional regulator|nr:transcriptional regulator, IclR family [Devosia sp.]
MAKEAERHVQAVAAALEVLAAFDADRPLRLKEIYERTGQHRSRLLRLLGTLEAYGFIESNEREGTYALGRVLHTFGTMVQERFERLSDSVRPALKRLVAATGDTAFFSSAQGMNRLVVASEESTEALRFTAKEGQTRPLHLGASSKVLLAFGDAGTLERAMMAVPDDERGALEPELAAIREAGFAVSSGQVTAHGFAVAVPVLRQGASGCDVLTLAGPLGKLGPDLINRYVEELRREAALLHATLPPFAAASAATAPKSNEES